MNNLAETAAFLSRVFIKEADAAFLQQAQLFSEELSTASAPSKVLSAAFAEELALTNTALIPDSVSAGQLEQLAVAYAKLFLGVGEKPVPLYESVYTSVDRLLYESHYFEVLDFYSEWGYELPAGFLEPADHLAIELDFLAARLWNADALLAAGQQEASHVQRTGAQAFKQAHLDPWVPQACDDILAATDCPLYRAAALLTKGLLKVI